MYNCCVRVRTTFALNQSIIVPFVSLTARHIWNARIVFAPETMNVSMRNCKIMLHYDLLFIILCYMYLIDLNLVYETLITVKELSAYYMQHYMRERLACVHRWWGDADRLVSAAARASVGGVAGYPLLELLRAHAGRNILRLGVEWLLFKVYGCLCPLDA